MVTRESVLEQALALPPDDQAFVADALEQELLTGRFASPEIAEAWSQEIDRRMAAYDRGEIFAVDFDTSLDRMRQALAEHRAHRNEA